MRETSKTLHYRKLTNKPVVLLNIRLTKKHLNLIDLHSILNNTIINQIRPVYKNSRKASSNIQGRTTLFTLSTFRLSTQY
jgi:hypothetical protein